MRIQLIHTSGPLKGQIRVFSEHKITIGRGKECEIKFPDNYEVVSLIHVIISWEKNRFKLINVGDNLTLLNFDKVIENNRLLNDGDVITLGKDGPKIAFLIYPNDDVPKAQSTVNDIDKTIVLSQEKPEEIMPCPAPSYMPSSAPQKHGNSRDPEKKVQKFLCRVRSREKPNDELANWSSIICDELNNLPMGQILFNPPKEMKVGQSERIEVRITQNLKIDLFEKLKGKGIPEVSIEKVAPFMTVKISGDDFDINAFHEEGQIISEVGYTEWSWDVLPLKSGAKKLHLLISVRIKLSFGEERKDFPIIDKNIRVNVNPIYSTKKFISNNWKWLATALVLPILGWAIKTIMK